jgi:hypothetical protein
MDAFPNAKALMTHRALEKTIPSICSMRKMSIQDSSSTFNPKQLGAEGIALYRDGLKAYLDLRKELPPRRFIDVLYKDAVSQPMAVYTRVLGELGLTLSAADKQAGADWMAANGRDTHPRHHYTPEEFGTTREELVRAFKFYADRFLPAA